MTIQLKSIDTTQEEDSKESTHRGNVIHEERTQDSEEQKEEEECRTIESRN